MGLARRFFATIPSCSVFSQPTGSGRVLGVSRWVAGLVFAAMACAGLNLAGAQITLFPAWHLQNPANIPPPRDSAAMAYDSAHNLLVLFGGININNGNLVPTNDTWTWDGTNWTLLSPVNSPRARSSAMMAYDAATGNMVLFGGEDGNQNPLNDTWTWDGTNWTNQTPSNPAMSPGARYQGGMAYDSAISQLVLFGGYGGSGELGDTWSWDGTNWTNLNPVHSPSVRSGLSMAYDTAGGNVVLFGGVNIGENLLLNDTWTWDGTDWTEQTPVAPPPARLFATMTYDAAIGQMVLFGGLGNGPDSNEIMLNDTWYWDAAGAWFQQSPLPNPAVRQASAMAFDAASSQVVLFGGTSGDHDANDTWTWNVGPMNLGSANVCPGGANTPSPCTQAATLSFNVPPGITIGSVNILTQGAPSLDFIATPSDSSGTLCTPQDYSLPTVCTVDVTFAPTTAGPRYGGVVIENKGGAVLANTYVSGTGNAPQVTFRPGTFSTLSSTSSSAFSEPTGLAVDAAGDVFVGDSANNEVKEIVAVNGSIPGSPTIKTLGSGFNYPVGVAVDGSGNVFVADSGNTEVKEMVAVNGSIPASPTINILGGGFSNLQGVEVDAAGDVFVADAGNNAVKEMVAVNGSIPASPIINVLGGGFNRPHGVAVDGSGNIYVADTDHNAVEEMPPGCASSSCVTTLGGGFSEPTYVAVDPSGNVYVAPAGQGDVKEIPAGCTATEFTAGSCTITTLRGGLFQPNGVALDGVGNVYFTDSGNNNVDELNVTAPPSLTFEATNYDTQSSDSPQTVTVSNIGNQPLSFPPPATGNNPSISSSFTLDSSTCPQVSSGGSAGTLNAGASCALPIDFIPQTVGSITGSVILTDNNLNQSAATQPIGLSGTGNPIPQTITFNNPGSQVQGGMLSLVASATSNLTVSFASTTMSVCTVSGSTASLIAPGQCTITASQKGDAHYAAATPVTLSFPVTSVFTLNVTPSSTAKTPPGTVPVVLTLASIPNGVTGSVTLSCVLPSGLPSGTKCPGLPVTVKLMKGSVVVHDTGVLFPKTTIGKSYVVTFKAVDGNYNDSITATFNIE